MPMVVSCPQCGRKLNAPEDLAGKRVKCPQCSSAVQIPASGSASPAPQTAQARSQPTRHSPAAKAEWYAEASDGTTHGPLSAEQLRALVGSGQLDEFSRVRKQETDSWQWLEAAFPDILAAARTTSGRKPARGDAATDAAAVAGERLHPCPDCGKMISKRAQQCPYCGCPVPTKSESPAAHSDAAAGVARSMEGKAAQGHTGWRIAAGITLALVVVGLTVFVGIQFLPTAEKQPPPPVPVAPVASPPTPTVTPEQKQQWIEEVSATTARELDRLYGQIHALNAMAATAQESANLIQELAQGKFPDAPTEAAKPQAAKPQAYQSQYASLCQECRAYLQANLPQGDFNRAKVEEVANAWAAEKRAPLEEQLQKFGQPILTP